MNNNLKKVEEFQLFFGKPVRKKPTLISKPEFELRVKLLKEELQELEDAYEANDLIEIADALIDIEYILHGTTLEMGFGDYNEILFDEVHSSNMSKACDTLDEANLSILSYKQKGVETYSLYKEEYGKYLILRSEDNKILKSINYNEANLTNFFN